MGIFDESYETCDQDGLEFGDRYRPPDQFHHGEWHRVATYPAEGDGHEVQVDECRMPARFYRIRALGRNDYRGQYKPGFVLSTGSGATKLAATLAEEISRGMLGATEVHKVSAGRIDGDDEDTFLDVTEARTTDEAAALAAEKLREHADGAPAYVNAILTSAAPINVFLRNDMFGEHP